MEPGESERVEPEPLDLVVVGGGPSGLAGAIAALRAGLSCEVIEKGVLVNSVYRYPHGMTFFTTAELLEIGDVPFVTPFPKPTREEALTYYRRVADAFALRVCPGEAVSELRREAGTFAVESRVEATGERRARRSRHVLVATGYYDHPNCIGVPGEDLPHVSHYFDEAHPFHRRDVVVVGGGNSAAEAALAAVPCRRARHDRPPAPAARGVDQVLGQARRREPDQGGLDRRALREPGRRDPAATVSSSPAPPGARRFLPTPSSC